MGTVKYTGPVASFHCPTEATIRSLKVHFSPKQNLNGQTKPWPAGGGKNILNMDWFTATNSYISSTGATGTMAYYSYTDYLELAPNTYTISGVNNTVNSNLRIHSYDENKEWVKQLASKYLAEGASFSLTFTVTSDDKYIRISAPAHTPEDPLLQLEVGSTATAYVPYENICPIEGWDGVTVHNDAIDDVPRYNIPLDYQRVEYIDSKDGAYFQVPFNIDTNQTLSVQAKLQYLGTSNNNVWLAGDGRQINSTQFEIGIYGNIWYKPNGTTTQVEIIKPAATIAQQLVIISLSREYTAAATLMWRLFGRSGYGEGASGLFNTRIYFLNINIDNTPIYNFIPCRRKSDDKPGMYDTVSSQFFVNQGTGEFICGPDVGQTYPVEFPAVGKNLFDYTNTSNWRVAITSTERVTTSSIGSISMNNNVVSLTRTHSYAGLTFILGRLEKDTQYCLSGTFTNIDNKAYIALLDSAIADEYTCTRKFTLSFSNGVVTFTPTQTGIYELLLWNSGTTTLSATQLQLEKASSATTYEPFNNTVYGGYVDLITGEVVKDRTIGQLTSSANFISTESVNNVYVRDFLAVQSHYYNGLCSHSIVWDGSGSTPSQPYMEFGVRSSRTLNWIGIKTALGVSTIQEFKDWLDTQTVICVVPLATPIHYTLAPTQLQTFLGQNNVWSNADYVEIEYDLHETQTILARKQFIMANQPHLAVASGSVASFSTDMRAPLPQCKVSFAPRQGGSGTASPTNVRPIYGLKYLSVLNSGKNLINVSTFTIGKGLNSSGQLQNWDSTMLSPYIPLPGGNYYVSGISRASGSNNLRIHGFDENKQWVKQIIAVSAAQNAEYAGTFNFESSNIKYIRVSVNINTENLQIEQGTSKSQYESYSGGLWTADWESAAGEVYGGYVDLATGEVWKEWNKVVIDGTQTLNSGGSYDGAVCSNRYISIPKYIESYTNLDTSTAISDKLISSNKTIWWTPDSYSWNFTINSRNQLHFVVDNNTIGILENDSSSDRTTKIATWLSNNPITVVYQLETPVLLETLTPTQLLSFKGTNNLYASHNTITAKYWTH